MSTTAVAPPVLLLPSLTSEAPQESVLNEYDQFDEDTRAYLNVEMSHEQARTDRIQFLAEEGRRNAIIVPDYCDTPGANKWASCGRASAVCT